MNIFYTSRFMRAYKKLPTEIKTKLYESEVIFRKNPFDPRLKTHKLAAEFRGYLAFSVDYKTRVIFRFKQDDEQIVYFESIGDHGIYKRI